MAIIDIHGEISHHHGDNPAFRKMLEDLSNGEIDDTVVLSNESYDCAETYTAVFLKTETVVASNTGAGLIKHKEAEWSNMMRRYARLHANDGFTSHKVPPERKLRHMTRNGESELVG